MLKVRWKHVQYFSRYRANNVPNARTDSLTARKQWLWPYYTGGGWSHKNKLVVKQKSVQQIINHGREAHNRSQTTLSTKHLQMPSAVLASNAKYGVHSILAKIYARAAQHISSAYKNQWHLVMRRSFVYKVNEEVQCWPIRLVKWESNLDPLDESKVQSNYR